MDFVANKSTQFEEMLSEIGVSSFQELIKQIPKEVLCERPKEDDGLSEYEAIQHMQQLGKKNLSSQMTSYLGAGAYEHHVPSIVPSLCSRGEFLTSYTPYQPEVSQGMLQAIFEYQSSICALTGMDVANASLYDGASACAEACLLALRSRKKARKLYVADSLHPHYRQVIQQYLEHQDVEWVSLPFTEEGTLDLSNFSKEVGGDIVGVVVQSPNFFGSVEELKTLFSTVKEHGGVNILCANPLSFGLFSSGAELGADVVVGDTQPFGISLQYGGAYAGYIACKTPYMRQMPGRIVGETVDKKGRKGYVITLQAREQHIRREKATSNICTNQALAALSSLIALMWYGKRGVPALALTNYQRTLYLKERLQKIPGVKVRNTHTTFNEFVVYFSHPLSEVKKSFHNKGILPGVEVETYYPQFKNCLLVAVTETKTQQQLDTYLETIERMGT